MNDVKIELSDDVAHTASAQTASERIAGIVSSVILDRQTCRHSLVGAPRALFSTLRCTPWFGLGQFFIKKTGRLSKNNRPASFSSKTAPKAVFCHFSGNDDAGSPFDGNLCRNCRCIRCHSCCSYRSYCSHRRSNRRCNCHKVLRPVP